MTHLPLTSQDHTRIAELCNDASWAAAMAIFLDERFVERGEVWSQINLKNRTMNVVGIRGACGVMSSGEQRLVRLATSFFDRGVNVCLYEELSGLDDHSLKLFHDAFTAFTGFRIDEEPAPVEPPKTIHWFVATLQLETDSLRDGRMGINLFRSRGAVDFGAITPLIDMLGHSQILQDVTDDLTIHFSTENHWAIVWSDIDEHLQVWQFERSASLDVFLAVHARKEPLQDKQ